MSDEFAVACSGCGAKWLSRDPVPPLEHCPRCPVSDRELDAIIEGLERIKALEGEIARLRLADSKLRAAVRALLDGVNDRYPDKNPREWTCQHMAALDRLVPPNGDE